MLKTSIKSSGERFETSHPGAAVAPRVVGVVGVAGTSSVSHGTSRLAKTARASSQNCAALPSLAALPGHPAMGPQTQRMRALRQQLANGLGHSASPAAAPEVSARAYGPTGRRNNSVRCMGGVGNTLVASTRTTYPARGSLAGHTRTTRVFLSQAGATPHCAVQHPPNTSEGPAIGPQAHVAPARRQNATS